MCRFTDLQTVIALPEELQALLVEGANRLGEIAEGGRVVEVEAAPGIVRQNPGEHRVLIQVIVCASGKRVELRSKVQITYFMHAKCIQEQSSSPAPPMQLRTSLTEQPAGLPSLSDKPAITPWKVPD